MNTYNDIYLETRRRLRAGEIAAHDLEARLIVECATGKSREELMKLRGLFVTDTMVLRAVEDMVARRLGGEPVAYIVGEWEFYGLPIIVNKSVLIPRVDTELLADAVIAIAKNKRSRILDLCAGSGCIGLTVAANVPNCRVLLADNSHEALKISRANILKNRLTRNVTAIEADALQEPPELLGRFDVIVSNPPYIPTGDIESLDNSVRDYEPAYALDGGHDGLAFYRVIASKWKSRLADGGYLAFECGVNQAESLREIMEENEFVDVRTLKDTLEIDRVVVGRLG
ncbi:MAG: peptide chain release factor N(5)-glutamine methyltransferase [Oscillospiraceae bacterium]|nr:peptide chain release factor N(5)-glutamine methyltransferase [Oscillospiraceae bacterium]